MKITRICGCITNNNKDKGIYFIKKCKSNKEHYKQVLEKHRLRNENKEKYQKKYLKDYYIKNKDIIYNRSKKDYKAKKKYKNKDKEKWKKYYTNYNKNYRNKNKERLKKYHINYNNKYRRSKKKNLVERIIRYFSN